MRRLLLLVALGGTCIGSLDAIAQVPIPNAVPLSETRADEPDNGAAIARARAAGVIISDEAARIMQVAPPGSCLSDPLVSRCPPVTRVEVDRWWSTDATEAHAARRRSTTRHRARAAQVTICQVVPESPDLINVSGNYKMRGTSRAACPVQVSYYEVTSDLQRYQNGAWATMSGPNYERGFASRGGGGSNIAATARYDCNHQLTYSYRTRALPLAVVNNVWFTGVYYAYSNHTCPT